MMIYQSFDFIVLSLLIILKIMFLAFNGRFSGLQINNCHVGLILYTLKLLKLT